MPPRGETGTRKRKRTPPPAPLSERSAPMQPRTRAVSTPRRSLVAPPTTAFTTPVQTLVEGTPRARRQEQRVQAHERMRAEVTTAVKMTPDERRQRYGFQTAATIERAQQDIASARARATEPKLEPYRKAIKPEPLPRGFTGLTPTTERRLRRAAGNESFAQDVLQKVGEWAIVGPDLAKAMRGEDYDPRWALVDLVTAPLAVVGGGPIRSGWAGARAALGLRRASRPVAEQAIRMFKGEEEQAYQLARRAVDEGRPLTVRERQFVNEALRRRPAAMQIETALGRARVLSRLGYSERPIRDLLIPNLIKRAPWSAAVKKGLKGVKVGDRVVVDVEHDLVGPHRQEGTLVEVGGNRLKYTDDEDRVHTIPYGRVIWAGSPQKRAPHGLDLPPFDEALSRLGAPRPADAISRGISDEILASGLPLPERLKDPNELAAAVDKVFDLAREGAEHRDWYVRAASSAENVFRHYEDVAPGRFSRSQIAQLMAIFSTGNDPTPNMKHVIDALEQHLEGKSVRAGMFPVAQSKEAEAVFRGEGWTGRKRNSFYANMLRHLDPDAYTQLQAELGRTGHPVTADMWVVRMFAPWAKREQPDQHYEAFEQLLTRMAQVFGWDPEEIQAAAWVAAKSRGIIGGEIRRGAATGNLRRVSTERAVERGADAYETGVRKYLRAGEPAPAGRVRRAGVVSGEERAGAGGAGDRGRRGGLPQFTELNPTRTSVHKYIDALRRNPRGWSVSEPTQARLRNSRIFLSDDGEAGFALHTDGELHSVFRNPGGPKGWGYEAALQAASRGAAWLNVYDIPAVRAKYEEAGFVEVARIAFNPEYAKPGVEEVGQPDVIFMAFGARPHPVRIFEDWDTAAAYTRELARPATPRGEKLTRPGFELEPSTTAAVERYREAATTGGRMPPGAMGIMGGGIPFFGRRAEQAAPSAEDRVGEAAQELMDWHVAHPSADPELRNEMIAQIAEHNGVDLNVFRSHLGISPTAEGASRAVKEALPGAQGTYHLQAHARREEIARRVGLGAQALESQEGRAGHYAALHELKGDLPQLNWGKFKNFDDEAVNALFGHIRGNPNLRFFEKLRAEQALLRAMEGRVPTPGQIKLLETVFGKQQTRNIRDAVPTLQKLKHLGFEVWNVPRSLMASFDLSAPFRQGLLVSVSHPRLFFRNFKSMVRAFGSENVYQSIMEDIATRPTFGLMQRAKLAITDLEDISTREEAFMGGNLAERIPIAGHGVRASGRAYTGFLNKTRADLFDMLISKAQAQGRDVVNDEKLLRSVASFVNSATGRGRAGETLEQHMVTLNSLFFSPRLLLSRLNFLNPLYYAHLDPFARKEALKAALGLVSTLSAILYIAKLGGAKVNTDPRNADFAKIRVNNTRMDLAGGFLPPIRLIAQLEQGKIVSSTTGKTLAFGHGFGDMTRQDVAKRFVETKLAPTPSLINDWFKGTDFEDKPFSWKKAAVTRMIPLVAQDVYDLHNETGNVPLSVAAYGVAGLGIGLQTYGPRPTKTKTLPPAGPGLGGGLGGSLGGSLGGPP